MKIKHILLPIYCALVLCSCGDDEKNVFHVDIVSYLDEGRDIEMVAFPGGTYAMGSTFLPPYTVVFTPAGPDTIFNTERPVHVVSVSSFLISKTEVTQEQYRAIMGANPSKLSGEIDLPVEMVSWNDAADFCNKLSEMFGYTKCYDQNNKCNFGANGFRLPTEAEWEYAARAGNEGEYYSGSGQSGLGLACWYSANSENKSHPVGRLQANAAGLFDIHGNVNEWCNDYFDFYTCGAESDPRGPEYSVFRVARGGSWASAASECRFAHRFPYQPASKVPMLGFRIVRRP